MRRSRSGSSTPEEAKSRTSSGNSSGSDGGSYRYGDDVGYVLLDMKCEYLGSVPVGEQSGGSVAAAAVKKIKKLKTSKRDVHLIVSPRGVFILDKKTKEHITDVPIKEVTFVQLDPTDNKLVCFITNNPALRLITCHAFKAKSTQAHELPMSINDAFQIDGGRMELPDPSGPRRRRSMSEAKDIAQKAKIAAEKSGAGSRGMQEADDSYIGAFAVKYLFSLAVPERTGFTTVDGALKQASEIGMPKGQGCILMVTSEGLRTVESMTQEVMSNIVIKEVSFVTVCGSKDKYFAFISDHVSSGRIVCHVYECDYKSKVAQAIAEAVGKAFQLAKEDSLNPFRPPKNATREEPPPELRQRQIHRTDLTAETSIGAGQFGQVWKAVYMPKDANKPTPVACKMLRNAASAEDKSEFTRECIAMLAFNHKHLMPLIGVAVQQKPWLAVIEFMPYGDVKSILMAFDEKSLPVSPSVLMHFCYQVAAGMEHMVEKNYVHMDLAARNILLGHSNSVKVADFGLAHIMDENGEYRMTSGTKLPLKWMSPEAMDVGIFSEASDVWAFGITMWEIFSLGATPYGAVKTSEIQDLVRQGLRPEAPDAAPKGFHDTCLKCWEFERHKRLTFAMAREQLLDIRNKLPAPPVEDIGIYLKENKDKKVVQAKPKRPLWYYGQNAERAVVDDLVKNCGQGDFIVRQVAPGAWALVVHDAGAVKMFSIKRGDAGKFHFGQLDPFDSLDDLVVHLRKNPVQGAAGPFCLAHAATKKRAATVAAGGGADGARPRTSSASGRSGSIGAKSNSASSIGEGGERRMSAGSATDKKKKKKKSGSVSSAGSDEGAEEGAGARRGSVSSINDDDFGGFGDMDANVPEAVEEEPFDPNFDKSWLVNAMPKLQCEAILKAGKPGDFLVRHNNDQSKYQIMCHDGPEMITVLAVHVEGGQFLFIDKVEPSIEDIIGEILGMKFKGKSGALLQLIRPPANMNVSTPASNGTTKESTSKNSTQGTTPIWNSQSTHENGSNGGSSVVSAANSGDDDDEGEKDSGAVGGMEKNNKWFVGSMKADEAEDLVADGDNGDYLVRKVKGGFTVMIKDGMVVTNVNVAATHKMLPTEGKGTMKKVKVCTYGEMEGRNLVELMNKLQRSSVPSATPGTTLVLNNPAKGGRVFRDRDSMKKK